MIDIRMSVETLQLRIEGHAGYADVGSDIVCAGVSMLAQTLAAHMCRADEADLMAFDMEDGLKLCMRPDSPRAAEYRTLYAFVQRGFELLANKYPDNVKLHTA